MAASLEAHAPTAEALAAGRVLPDQAAVIVDAVDALPSDLDPALAASARLSMVDDGHGRVHGRFTLPSVQGAMLRKALLAIAAPKHQAAVTGQAPAPRPDGVSVG